MKSVLSVLCVASVCFAAPPPLEEEESGQIWAVLVAGSYTYENYRHQANICHAYQIFHRHGVPDSNIIVMMFDDIADNEENPKKGTIINRPNGPDVYKGVPKDYTGAKVTPKHFINVLTGKGPGKVLKSGKNDKVFVYFADHGSTGLIAFPGEFLYADDLIEALKTMHKKNLYKKLVFYLEACESGSMFEQILPDNLNILAVTSANANEDSWGCYCKYPKYKTCLGDMFGVNWMEDTEKEESEKKYNNETVEHQYEEVVKKTKKSHPQLYGQTSMTADFVSEYLGGAKSRTYRDMDSWSEDNEISEEVSSREMAVFYLKNKVKNAENGEKRKDMQKQLDALLEGRKSVDRLFASILSHVTGLNVPRVKDLEESRPALTLEDMPCYKNLVDTFNDHCVNINKNTYALGHLYKLANLCQSGYSETQVLEAFSAKCEARHRKLVAVD